MLDKALVALKELLCITTVLLTPNDFEKMSVSYAFQIL